MKFYNSNEDKTNLCLTLYKLIDSITIVATMAGKYYSLIEFETILTIYIFSSIFIGISFCIATCPEYAGIKEDCNCSKCLPGLLCNAAEICDGNTSSCHYHQWTNSLWKPSCEADGSWSAIQCKGELLNGRCFCYDPKGTRIFGWSWWTKNNNMTCACSRRRAELKKIRDDVSLHCTENGNYEELQCDNGLCWCVESETGIPTQRIYPDSVMKYLPCYDENQIGSQYLRQCESKHIARSELLEKLRVHGIEFVHTDDVYCDDDGSYGFYRLAKKLVHCTWKDSKQIELYQGPISEIFSMNCHCARDTRIFSNKGIEMILTCQNNGNYDPNQIDNGRSFCVDDDGFPTTPLSEFGQTIACPPIIIENETYFRNEQESKMQLT